MNLHFNNVFLFLFFDLVTWYNNWSSDIWSFVVLKVLFHEVFKLNNCVFIISQNIVFYKIKEKKESSFKSLSATKFLMLRIHCVAK